MILIKDLGRIYPNKNSKQKKRYGVYKCECGNEFTTQTYSVKSGNTNSCGCKNMKQVIDRITKHNLANSKIYSVWCSIKYRTLNINSKDYDYYGGRGVTVCDEWKNDFMSFYNWSIDNGYTEGLSIDRINNDGNYEPSNCRWTTKATQSRNTKILKSNNTSGFRGVHFDRQKCRYICQITVNKKKICIGSFMSKIDAARAYDNYVIANDLEHTTNGVTK